MTINMLRKPFQFAEVALLLTAVLALVGPGAKSVSAQASAPPQTASQKSAACEAPQYRQFDFWAGDWEVHAPDGTVAGHNRVTIEQGGCLLVEHWTSANGHETGTSFNYYDVRDKKWHQLYIDNSGNAGAFPAMAGNLADGKMVLLTDEQKKPVWRWSWYVLEPGKVRQMAEQSSDGGQTWKIGWDSVYVKVESAAPPAK